MSLVRRFSQWEGWADVTVGLPVALLALPQAMAYALVAEIPLSAGIFSAVLAVMISGSVSHSRSLIFGPTNTAAILLQSGTAEFLYTYHRNTPPDEKALIALQVMMQIAVFVGLLQILASLMKLGRLTEFVSRSVMVGYLAAASITLAVSQLFPFLWLDTLHGYHSIVEKLYHITTHSADIDVTTLGWGLSAIVALLALRLAPRKLPTAAIMLGAAALSAFLWTWWHQSYTPDGHVIAPVTLVDKYGGVQTWLPVFSPPAFDFRVFNATFPSAVALALVGILETSAFAKSDLAGESIKDVDRDIFALGLSNFGVGLFGAMPGSVSPSRTALNVGGGARTRLAAISSGIWVWVLVMLFSGLVRYIPLACLAGLLLVMAATRVVDWRELKSCYMATGKDRAALIATTVSALFLSLHIAFFVGVLVSITLYLRDAAKLHVTPQRWQKPAEVREILRQESPVDDHIRVLDVEGELFFGAAAQLEESLRSIADEQQAKVVVLHLRNARHLDATSCIALNKAHGNLSKRGHQLILCGLTADVWKVMRRVGMPERVGEENCFLHDVHQPLASAERALARARLIGRTD